MKKLLLALPLLALVGCTPAERQDALVIANYAKIATDTACIIAKAALPVPVIAEVCQLEPALYSMIEQVLASPVGVAAAKAGAGR